MVQAGWVALLATIRCIDDALQQISPKIRSFFEQKKMAVGSLRTRGSFSARRRPCSIYLGHQSNGTADQSAKNLQ
jgi:hypothetical protein